MSPPDKPALKTVKPSSATSMRRASRPRAAAGVKAALLRGALTHRLLQSLPDIPADRRAKAAADYLARAGAELTAEERGRISEQVMLVTEDPRFYELYGPASRAEVPIVGKVEINGEAYRVSGQVDRLAVTQDAVLIADFKTNRDPPRRIADVPRSLRAPARALPRRAAKAISRTGPSAPLWSGRKSLI